jgi:hypothetical protein
MSRFRTRRMAIAVGLALMALVPTTALAASRTATEAIVGVETGIPSACGPSGSGESMSGFAGVATGTIKGVWSASVCHTDLSIAPGPKASISGGGFHVSGVADWRVVRLSGSFTSGSIDAGTEIDHVISGVGTCTQVFGLSITGSGPSSFTATLMHYGVFFAGGCHVLSATLSGTGHITY